MYEEKIPDPNLRQWAESGQGTREVIVEVVLPPRENKHILLPSDDTARTACLNIAKLSIEQLTGVTPNVLKAAGALAFSATPNQVGQLTEREFVTVIRPNRQIGRRSGNYGPYRV